MQDRLLASIDIQQLVLHAPNGSAVGVCAAVMGSATNRITIKVPVITVGGASVLDDPQTAIVGSGLIPLTTSSVVVSLHLRHPNRTSISLDLIVIPLAITTSLVHPVATARGNRDVREQPRED